MCVCVRACAHVCNSLTNIRVFCEAFVSTMCCLNAVFISKCFCFFLWTCSSNGYDLGLVEQACRNMNIWLSLCACMLSCYTTHIEDPILLQPQFVRRTWQRWLVKTPLPSPCTPMSHLTRMPCSLQEENDVNTIFYIMTDRHRKKNKIPNTVTAAMLKQSNTSLSSVPVPLHKYGRDTVDTIWTKRLGIHLAYNYIYRTASIHNEPHTCTYINSHDQKHNHITRHIKETKIKDNARFIFFTLIHVWKHICGYNYWR